MGGYQEYQLTSIGLSCVLFRTAANIPSLQRLKEMCRLSIGTNVSSLYISFSLPHTHTQCIFVCSVYCINQENNIIISFAHLWSKLVLLGLGYGMPICKSNRHMKSFLSSVQPQMSVVCVCHVGAHINILDVSCLLGVHIYTHDCHLPLYFHLLKFFTVCIL